MSPMQPEAGTMASTHRAYSSGFRGPLRTWTDRLARLAGIAHQRTDGEALPDRFLDDQVPNAAGCADDQHGHAGNGHLRLPVFPD
jgi:hypothetical protein